MKRLFIFLFASSIFFFACTSTNKNLQNQKKECPQKEFDEDVKQIVKKMTIRQKIGQLFLVNFRYCAISEATKYFNKATDFETSSGKIVKVVPLDSVNKTVESSIKKYHFGNIILFGENFISIDNSIKFISDLQTIAIQNNDLPLIISIDQEGGRVNRIYQTAIFPSAKKIGNTNNLELAFLEGKYLGQQLSSIGINLNFAPVCDVNSNPKNPIIGDRSFSSNPNKAGEFATEVFKGMESENIIACAKHFPGHGDTTVDSHIGLPTIKKSKKQWDNLESIPFKKIINSGIPVIMSAHIQYPELDNSKLHAKKTGKQIIRPATLSKTILTNILRHELNFNGVICTDALDMKAITKNFTESQAIIEAINAGADLICNPFSIIQQADLEKIESIYIDIENAIKNKSLPIERLNNAVCRIVQLKKDYNILQTKNKPVTKQAIAESKKILNSPVYRQFANKIKTSY